MSETAWEQVANVDDFAGTDRVSVIIDDLPALIVQLEGEYFAIEDVCTHDGQPLTDGAIIENSIECPRHGARFDLKSGAPLCMPATQPVQTFEVDIREGVIFARPSTGESNSAAPASSTASASATTEAAAAGTSEQSGEDTGVPSTGPQEAPRVGDMLDSLKKVVDPELFVNIVDLGLVYDITEDNNQVTVTMTLTSPSCPAGPQIVAQAREAIESMPGVDGAEIKLTMSPPWTPEMMTEDARDQLGIF
ncbi:iron-sulfur cluster assembly protein [Rubinisphaera margarita]|uniref:iron-sulfur cluster assembly protein n=1 Tax=Rubinisphaera margarita TaxID=2909586 RepID=UPI001EE91EAE|nr:iron-sulfur cluster assembly protein [Rubinisphaera margarita]MCG6156117.1 iron-sulfur cluster assembly protein [Rubinisphaera margarita]